MAKVTIVLTDDGEGHVSVDFIPEPDYEGDADLTPAQDSAMKAMMAILGDETNKEVAIYQ